jgi:hypothetical protein
MDYKEERSIDISVHKQCRLCGSEFDDSSSDGRHDDCSECESKQWDSMVEDLKSQGFKGE